MSRRLRFRLLVSLLTLGCAYTLASWDWCGDWTEREPLLLTHGSATGPLSVGAGRVPVAIPKGVPRAGYPPPRPEAEPGPRPLHARALVLEVGETRIALASIDALSAAPSVVARVRAEVKGLGLDAVHVFATHTHSGIGGYDPRLISELAGTGKHEEVAEEALVTALSEAIALADARREPATMAHGLAESTPGVGLRSEGEGPDERLDLLRFETASATHTLLLFAAHPTLVPRGEPRADPDFPGRISQRLEREGTGDVALFLQTAVGNTWVTVSGSSEERLELFAEGVVRTALATQPIVYERLTLAHARVQVTLPRPESKRLVPSLLHRVGDNVICHSSSKEAEVGALRLGPLTLFTLPVEVTAAAGRLLAAASGAERVLSLADGYFGYVETPGRVRANKGEARRQYFPAHLLEILGSGGEVAVAAMGGGRDGGAE